jgi:hypothetical protein
MPRSPEGVNDDIGVLDLVFDDEHLGDDGFMFGVGFWHWSIVGAA